MLTTENDNLYDGARKLWGRQLQALVFSEEFGELIKLISKVERGFSINSCDIAEEIADSIICIEQISNNYDISYDDIRKAYEYKVQRLRDNVYKKTRP